MFNVLICKDNPFYVNGKINLVVCAKVIIEDDRYAKSHNKSVRVFVGLSHISDVPARRVRNTPRTRACAPLIVGFLASIASVSPHERVPAPRLSWGFTYLSPLAKHMFTPLIVGFLTSIAGGDGDCLWRSLEESV